MSDDLAIRARPRPVKRFSKKVLMAGAGGLAVMLSAAIAFALAPVDYETGKNTELYNVTHKPMADEIERLPKTYAEVKPAQASVLGPPLPGDLGEAYLNKGSTIRPKEENPFRYKPAASRAYAAPKRAVARVQSVPPPNPEVVQKEAIRQSKLFFEVGQSSGSVKNRIETAQTRIDPFASLAGLQEFGLGENRSAHLPSTVSNQIYNSGELESPRSPYQVMAGTLIPATLVTGLNSDLPGQVIGQVTENIYDTVTGRHLLIPQGAKLIGSYENRNSFGDTRAFVTWSRLIFPNGNSIVLDDLGTVDGVGHAGLRDKVDAHTGKVIKASVLSSVLGIGAELSSDDDDRIIRALQNSGQQTVNIAGQRMVDRSLNVEPTITIRPGWRFSVLVSRDIILKPYHN